MPPDAIGVVVLACSRKSARASEPDVALARTLQDAGLATLQMDLVTVQEEQAASHLAASVVAAIDWLAIDAAVGDLPPSVGRLPVGCYGAGVGAGAALIAAAERPGRVRAVVSGDGWPDLSRKALTRLKAPTRLIVGGVDTEVPRLARDWFVRHLSADGRR